MKETIEIKLQVKTKDVNRVLALANKDFLTEEELHLDYRVNTTSDNFDDEVKISAAALALITLLEKRKENN